MLNVGKLSPGATEYYIGEVATSAEDYYAGRGEAQGRWVGSLARELGLSGAVDSEHFRRVLQGKDPFTGKPLVTARGSAARAGTRRATAAISGDVPEQVDTLRAAAHLGVSTRYVRRLLEEGQRYQARLDAAEDGEVVAAPSAYLGGTKAGGDGRPGADAWSVSRSELERFAESRRKPKARPGYDLTLRPPKSVSVVWALADGPQREAIRQAHAEAVDEVVRYYESTAVFVREGRGGRRLRTSAGVVAAAFDHRTSRAGDPLLHTHVVTANMTTPVDATASEPWRAIAGSGVFEHARAAGSLYQAHLRHLLATRLGVGFHPVVNGYAEVVGVPDAVVRLFSKRRQEIEEVLAESGNTSARAAQVATLETRQAKDYDVDTDTLDLHWRDEAEGAGFGAPQLAACFGRELHATRDDEFEERLFAALADSHGLTERASTFCRSDVIEAVASAMGTLASARDVERIADRFLASSLVLDASRSVPIEKEEGAPSPSKGAPSTTTKTQRSFTQRTYTTRQLAELEHDLLTWGHSPRRGIASVPAETLARVLTRRPELSAEQRAMVLAACASGEFLQPIAGRPGAGKTYATEALVAAHVACGIPIVGCAVSAAAAAELERAAGFARSGKREASTVARLLVELDHEQGSLRPGTVIVVDEASMIGTRALHRLADAADAAGGSIKLIGDPDQHGSVDVGGVFRRLCADRADQLVELVENNRQTDPAERLAITEYREGKVADALARYDDDGKVVRSATAGESYDAMVADWYAARLLGESDPMIAGPNSTRRALNDRARVLLKASGEIAGPALVAAGREFMVGDEIVARRNDRTLHADGSADHVKNGSVGTVRSVDERAGELVVDFIREGTVRILAHYLRAGHVDHAYARTTYGVQGATHTTARYHPTDSSSYEEGYVAITRGRAASRIYIVDGTVAEHDLDRHDPEPPRHHGIHEITDALSRRRARHMAADASPDLAELGATLDRMTIAELAARRRELEHAFAAAPLDSSRIIDKTSAALDTIHARRRAVVELNARSAPPADPAQTPEVRDATITALDRAASELEDRLQRARRRSTERARWLQDHGELIHEHDLVRRAERAHEHQVRTAARVHVPAAFVELLGEEPNTQRERAAWREAAEAVAIYHARHPDTDVHVGEQLHAVLGRRPSGSAALADYELALRTLEAAQDPEVSPVIGAHEP